MPRPPGAVGPRARKAGIRAAGGAAGSPSPAACRARPGPGLARAQLDLGLASVTVAISESLALELRVPASGGPGPRHPASPSAVTAGPPAAKGQCAANAASRTLSA